MAYGLEQRNTTCINRVAGTVLELLNVESAKGMAEPIPEVLQKAEECLGKKDGAICDRVFMYNPDAVAMWVYGKYAHMFEKVEKFIDLKLNMLSVFPSVTPVCFGSMYSGLMPSEHGITSYIKPVLTCPTIFDCLIQAGKKVAILATHNSSISMIFLNRQMDYFIYETVEEANAKASELIQQDNYDCIVLYNGDYDSMMHRHAPEGEESIQALQDNIDEYTALREQLLKDWKGHRIALAFAPDHGCHEKPEGGGSHGTDELCDMNIHHLWTFLKP